MPEIALTTQFRERFERRFGARRPNGIPASATQARARCEPSRAARRESSSSARARRCSCPSANSGSSSSTRSTSSAYKQEDGALYHARDMAVVRGRIENAPVVLASATPSLETRVNAQSGRYAHLRLPQRYGGARTAALAAIDLRAERAPARSLDRAAARTAIAKRIAEGEQALLFLNRRGYAPLTLCRACGHRFRCPTARPGSSSIASRRSLRCHHCGHRERRPDNCPNCGALDSLDGLRTRRRASRGGGRDPVSRSARAGPLVGHAGRRRTPAPGVQRYRRWKGRHCGRHAACRERTQFSGAHVRRRHRRRSRTRERRPARVRTDVPVDAAGDGSRRARRKAWPRLSADASSPIIR